MTRDEPTDLHARASALFLELRALPSEQRAAALEAAAARDEHLCAEVESLLLHDLEDGAAPRATHPDSPAAGDAAPGPARIGPYRVVARVGSGGSGHVFLALQEEPIRRRVAIKIVPQAALSAELAARFDVERRALERTEHPNVARVLDAGRTPDGMPYLVMEFIEGEPINAYCERRALPLPARIRLLLDVSYAVQHVHQRGVIHRDIKPGNVLVSEVGGRAIPHVLDFGIAKPIEAFAADLPATAGLPLGTPSYMAPEQTGLADVDTRADVYALGALLYELAAGRPPIEAGGDMLDLLRRIREEVPPPASRVRLAHAGGPGSRPPPKALAADLDCVLAKALEKSPERRYASAGAFAADLQRLLASEPIEARPPRLGYRAARFARRNRVLVAAGGAVALALILGLVGLVLGLVEANRQRRSALDENEAQREINRFLTDDLLAQASPEREGKDVTALDLLNRASSLVDQRFPGRPLIAATIHHALGEAYAELGDLDRAEHHVARAVAMRRAAAGSDSPDAVRAEIAAASIVARRQRYPEAERALRAAIARGRLLLGPDDPVLYAALNDLGVTLQGLGRYQEALQPGEEALAGRERLLGPEHREVLISMSNLALAHDGLGDVQRSLELLRAALEIAEATPEESRMMLLGMNNNIGATLQDLGKDAEAAPYLRRAAEIADELLGPTHPATITIQGNLADLEAEHGTPELALELYDNVVRYQTEHLGPQAVDTLTSRSGYWNCVLKTGRFDDAARGFDELLADVADALGEEHWLTAHTRAFLASALLEGGRLEDALPLAEHAEEQLHALYGPDNPRTKSASSIVAEIRARRAE